MQCTLIISDCNSEKIAKIGLNGNQRHCKIAQIKVAYFGGHSVEVTAAHFIILFIVSGHKAVKLI